RSDRDFFISPSVARVEFKQELKQCTELDRGKVRNSTRNSIAVRSPVNQTTLTGRRLRDVEPNAGIIERLSLLIKEECRVTNIVISVSNTRDTTAFRAFNF